MNTRMERDVMIPAAAAALPGTLVLPAGAPGVVLFAHGSGSSRLSPRSREVAAVLQRAGIGTLLFDLLTEAEAHDRRLVFDIELLARRLEEARRWLHEEPAMQSLAVGYFGASTGAAAALIAAADQPGTVRAIVSRGGRPDLAGEALERVTAPTLLIVGGADIGVVELNESAYRRLRGEKRLAIVPGATHLFEEAGALEQVARLASEWFRQHLAVASIGPVEK
jgi:dienelactone hydrolase